MLLLRSASSPSRAAPLRERDRKTIPELAGRPAAPIGEPPPSLTAPSTPIADLSGGSVDGRWWLRLRLAVEVMVLYLACAVALVSASPTLSGAPDRWLAVVFPMLVLLIPRAAGWSDHRLDGSVLDATVKVLGAVSLAAVAMVTLDSLAGGADPVAFAARLGVFAAVYLGVARAVLLAVRRRAQRSGALRTPTLIIGAGLVGQHLARRLTLEPRFGLRPVGFLDADPLPGSHGSVSLPVLGGLDDLGAAIERSGARHVVLAFLNAPDSVLVDEIRECEKLGVDVSLVPRLYELINERASLDHVGGLPLLSLHTVDPRGWQFAVKHMLGRSVALLALILLSPLMAAIAIAVRWSSPGGVIFRQRRIGRDGHEFDVLKFRTMRADPDPDPDPDPAAARRRRRGDRPRTAGR